MLLYIYGMDKNSQNLILLWLGPQKNMPFFPRYLCFMSLNFYKEIGILFNACASILIIVFVGILKIQSTDSP